MGLLSHASYSQSSFRHHFEQMDEINLDRFNVGKIFHTLSNRIKEFALSPCSLLSPCHFVVRMVCSEEQVYEIWIYVSAVWCSVKEYSLCGFESWN